MKLKEQFLACATEYARQFGQIIELDKEFWTGTRPGHHALFGNYYAFTLEEMSLIVDDLDKWAKKYGSRKEVGRTVIEWFDRSFAEYEHTKHQYPRINLQSYMNGLRYEDLNKNKVKL
jgi:hypothetical protein